MAQDLLFPLARLYARLMSWRETAYARNWLARWRPPAPCISIGNIRWGGTGKTPLCLWLLHWAESRNLSTVLLTRGYGGSPPALPYLVGPDSPADQAGDEPLLLARAAPGARIVTDPVRTRSGPWAWNQWRPDLFILDDGFQHLPILRDLDLVLLLPEDLDRDWDRVIPAGPWREGRAALNRADAFLVRANKDEWPRLGLTIQKRPDNLNRPSFSFFPSPRCLTDLRTRISARNLDQPYLLVSGVARPSSVEQTAVALLAAAPARHIAHGDHHSYTPEDVLRICREAESLNIRNIVCTAKDAVKLEGLLPGTSALNWWSLEMDVAFGPHLAGHEGFENWLESWWVRMGRCAAGSLPVQEPR